MKRLAVLPIVALALFAVAGCGSDDDSDTSSTQAATVPDDRVGASAAPPELGYYAGVSCPESKKPISDSYCGSFYNHAREGARAYCHGGKPNPDRSPTYTDPHGKKYSYVCFTLKSANNLVDFYVGRTKIVNSVHVSSDRFPETCDNGYCIQGEWFDTENVAGKWRNPNSVYNDYRAEWIGS